ncbi:hypothetical protein ACSBR1_016382 [Camellia fascicularis]
MAHDDQHLDSPIAYPDLLPFVFFLCPIFFLIEACKRDTEQKSANRQDTRPPLVFNFPLASIKQLTAAQYDTEVNSHTLKSCVDTETVVSNMSRWLQSRVNKVQQLTAQLTLSQRMYQDAQREISQLKRQNKELKCRATIMERALMPGYTPFDGQRGYISFERPPNARARSLRASAK